MSELDTTIIEAETTTENIEKAPMTLTQLVELIDVYSMDENKLGLEKLKNGIIESINMQSKAFLSLGEDSEFDELDDKIKHYTEDQIEAMSLQEIDSIFYNNDDGKEISVKVVKDVDEFKKGYIKERRSMLNTMQGLQDEIDNLEKKMVLKHEELVPFLNEIDYIPDFLSEQIKRILEEDQTVEEETKIKLAAMLEGIHEAFSLDQLIASIASSPKTMLTNTLRELSVPHMVDFHVGKYEELCNLLHVNSSISAYPDFEKTYLDEKYHPYNNLFIFIIIRKYAYAIRRKGFYPIFDSTFLQQISLILKLLKMDKMPEDKKQQFLENVTKLIDLYI